MAQNQSVKPAWQVPLHSQRGGLAKLLGGATPLVLDRSCWGAPRRQGARHPKSVYAEAVPPACLKLQSFQTEQG